MKETQEKPDSEREAAVLDNARWAFINEWQVESQSTDRTPMRSAVANAGQTPSEQRSFARRSHQLRYKEWSQERHD
jgi:hypothetical protein